MTRVIRLLGGPYADLEITGEGLNTVIGLPVDHHGRRSGTPDLASLALYQTAGNVDSNVYNFAGFKRPDGEPLLVEFVGGPIPGTMEMSELNLNAFVHTMDDGTPFVGLKEPSGVAVYVLTETDNGWVYLFDRVDSSPEIVSKAVADIREDKIAAASRRFYANPDYNIYSEKPTGRHTQVPLEVGWRRGHVDAGIVPVLSELWRLGLDTIGSCEEREPGSKSEGQAYVGFARRIDANRLHEWLNEAGINSSYFEKMIGIAFSKDDGTTLEKFELEAGNVLFDPRQIEPIAEVLRSKDPVRE